MIIFVFAENAIKGRDTAAKIVKLKVIGDGIERRKNDIVTMKRENKSIGKMRNVDDGNSGKKLKSITKITTALGGEKKEKSIGKELHQLFIFAIMHYQKNYRRVKREFAIFVGMREL